MYAVLLIFQRFHGIYGIVPGEFDNWVGLAACFAVFLGSLHCVIFLIARTMEARHYVTVEGKLVHYRVKKLGLLGGGQNRAVVDYLYNYKGIRYAGTKVNALYDLPLIIKTGVDGGITRLGNIYRDGVPLIVYVNEKHPQSSILIRYPLGKYIAVNALVCLVTAGLTAGMILSKDLHSDFQRVFGLLIGIVGYIMTLVVARSYAD